MFLKIKLDPYRQSSAENECNQYIKVHNAECILYIKQQITKLLNIPVEAQMIKTVTRVYADTESIDDLLCASENGGTALQLYKIETDAESAEFICFLQLYSDLEAAEQQKLDEKSKDPNFFRNLHGSTISLITTSDSESSSKTDSTSSGSGSETENSKSSNSSITDQRKRRKTTKSIQKMKSARIERSSSCLSLVIPSHIETLSSYSTSAQCTCIEETKETVTTTETRSQTSPNVRKENQDTPESTYFTPPLLDVTLTNESVNASNSRVQVNATSSTTMSERNLWVDILPEMRQYLLVISNNNGNVDRAGFEDFLSSFFDIFQQTNVPALLQFNENSAVNLHKGKMWISCENETSVAWTSDNISKMNKSYKVETYINHMNANGYQWHECNVIMPTACGARKDCKIILDILEKQNAGLCTEQWVIMKRHFIMDKNDAYFERCVSKVCDNEVLHLFVDQTSKLYLEKLDYKLKYCFWKIVFEMKK